MENITEWAGRIDKKRSKPSKQLQEELFNRVTTALKEGTNTYDECVAAFAVLMQRLFQRSIRIITGQIFRIPASGMQQFFPGQIRRSPLFPPRSEWLLFSRRN